MRRFNTTALYYCAAPVLAAYSRRAAATSSNAAANASTKSAPSPPKKQRTSAIDFPTQVLGGGRLCGVHPAGRHVTVYNDSNMIAWIVMDRDESSANALGEEFMENLAQSIDVTDRLVAAGTVQFAVLTSAKSTFCVGADLEQLYPITDRQVAVQVPSSGHTVFNRIEHSRYPIIAAVNGLALGGGFELALACHDRLLASTAKVGFPECLLGLLPGAGGTVRTQRRCGLATTVSWVMSSKQVRPHAAVAAGAAATVLPAEDRWTGEHRFLEGVRRWAGQYLSDRKAGPPRQARGSPSLAAWALRLAERTDFGRKKIADEAVKALNKTTKGKFIGHYKALECIMYSATHTDAQGYQRESEGFAELLCSPEAKNQMALYFLDEGMKKSEAKTGVPKSALPPLKRAGVLGAGVMGSGVAHYFVNKGIPVAMKDLKQEVVDAGRARVQAEFAAAVKRKRLTPKELEAKMALLTAGTTDAVFADCDIIVEAAVEVMEVKKKLIQQLEKDKVIHAGNIFATNTSSLSLTEMQTVSQFPQNIVGMHFFNPVAKMPLVEVILGGKTSKEAAASVFNLALQTGKKPILVRDGPGFLVNRILGVYMAEAGRLATVDRCDPAKVDEAIVAFGMPMGPFRLLDEVGLDVACHVGPVLQAGLQSDRFAVSDGINAMLADGLLGKKNKKGFYHYDEKGKDAGFNRAHLDKYISKDLSPSAVPASDIVDRCVLLMVNEAAMILTEKIANSPEDVDIGMVWGTGFPAFRGGLLQYADHRGLDKVVSALEELQRRTKSDRFAPCPMLKAMAEKKERFFPHRPFVPYKERVGFPKILY